MVRAGLEPATHGFSVRQRPNENNDEKNSEAKPGRFPGQFVDFALNDLIELWPSLSLADQSRIHSIAFPNRSSVASDEQDGKIAGKTTGHAKQAIKGLRHFRQDIEALIDATPKEDHLTLGLLGQSLADLRSAQANIEQLQTTP